MNFQNWGWKTCAVIALPILLIPFIKFYAPKVHTYYSEPLQCVVLHQESGEEEFCLDDKFRVPLTCIMDKEESKTKRCQMLKKLAQSNEKSVAFVLLGHEIRITRMLPVHDSQG